MLDFVHSVSDNELPPEYKDWRQRRCVKAKARMVLLLSSPCIFSRAHERGFFVSSTAEVAEKADVRDDERHG